MTAKPPAVGETVKVFKGRSAPIGSVGVVFWARVYRYGKDKKTGRYARITTRLGCRETPDSEPFWTYSDNVEVLGAPIVDVYETGLCKPAFEAEPVPF